MAGGGAGQPDCRGTCWPRAPGATCPARASDAFVEKVFDGFAASFDSKLAKLSYRAPALVGAMLADSGLPAAKELDVLDAGCGTGLCGPLVAPYRAAADGRRLCRPACWRRRSEKRSTTSSEGRADGVSARPSGGVRRDRLGRHARLLRRLERGRVGRVRGAAPGGLLIFTVEESVGAATRRRLPHRHARPLQSRAALRRACPDRGGLAPRDRARRAAHGIRRCRCRDSPFARTKTR